MRKKLRYLIPAVLILIALIIGCGSRDPDMLSPTDIDPSMLDQIVKVEGKITLAVENPGGLGGTYLELDGGEVGVRIQDDLWTKMSEAERARYEKGKKTAVQGRVFVAGRQLVIVFIQPAD